MKQTRRYYRRILVTPLRKDVRVTTLTKSKTTTGHNFKQKLLAKT
jgi:hypothetical protein